MSTQIIPFNESKLPAYLKKALGQVSASDLTEGVGGGFPYLSIKGKTWTVVRGKDDRKILRNPKDPDEPATNVAVVILKASKTLGRVFYEKTWEDGDASKPDCFSHDSTKPDPASEKPQAKTCAACKHAVFVQGKGPACRQSRRLAVAPLNAINDPMLLRVPAASLKNLAIYGGQLAKRSVPYHVVVTKVKFDAEEATPKLIFDPVGFVPEELLEEIGEIQSSEIIDQILGVTGDVEGEATPEPETDEVPSVEEVEEVIKEKPKAKAKPKAKPAPEPEPEEDEAEEAEEEPEEEAPAPKAKPKAKAKTESTSDLDDLLSDFDD